MVTYHQLQTFLAVARTGSLTKAAREMNATQPTVSLQLRQLRNFLGTSLFERPGGRFQLTPAGESLRRYAGEAVGGLRMLQQEIAAQAGIFAGPLSVGAAFVTSRHVLPAPLSRFLQQFPGVDLQLHVEFPEQLFAGLLANRLDVACYIGVPAPAGLTVESLVEDELVVIASPQHALAGRRLVSPQRLSEEPFVAVGSTLFRRMIEAKLQVGGVTTRPTTEARHQEAGKRIVERNLGNKSLDSPASMGESGTDGEPDGGGGDGISWGPLSPRHWEELVGDPNRLIVMLKAHGDASVAGGIISVALWLGRAADWDAVEGKWRDATKGLGPLPFRMTDFIAREKDPQLRLVALSGLVEIICGTALIGTVAVMNEAAWAILPRSITERIGPTPYYVLASLAFGQTVRWRKDNGHTEPIVCVFESGPEEAKSGLRQAALFALEHSEVLREEFGIEDLVFAPKGRSGLSMADMLAWLMTHWVPELRLKDDISGALVEQIGRKTPLYRAYISRDLLVSMARENNLEMMREVCARFGINPEVFGP